MNRKLDDISSSLKFFALALTIVFSAPMLAQDKLPETTKDGLQLQEDTKLAAVYLKPGETLEGYDEVI
jgi:hypothetical protein